MIAAAAAAPCSPRALFARSLAASGATPAQRAAELVATGTVAALGLHGTFRLASDGATGRVAERTRLPVVGETDEVSDGRESWTRDPSGGVRPLDSPFRIALARTESYLARHAYDDPRAPAAMRCDGVRTLGGSRVTDVRVTPPGGIAVTLSLDDAGRLVADDEAYPTTHVAMRWGDYRRWHGMVLPFAMSLVPSSQPGDAERFTVLRYELRAPAAAADFARPVPDDRAAMLDGARATTVPIDVERDRAIVAASIDGRAAMPFLLDSGGAATLTPRAARALGLRPTGAAVTAGAGAGTAAVGFAATRTIRIGSAELRDQPVRVIALGDRFSGRGPGRAPLAGILGVEIFERFATQVDYGARRLTLTPLAAYRPRAGARAVPIVFENAMPLAGATADGFRGLFQIDTGSVYPLVLFGGFVRSTGLGAVYPAGTAGTAYGVGGRTPLRTVRVGRFTFGGLTWSDVPTALTAMRGGLFATDAQAGNVGGGLLARVVPTFDYARESIEIGAAAAR